MLPFDGRLGSAPGYQSQFCQFGSLTVTSSYANRHHRHYKNTIRDGGSAETADTVDTVNTVDTVDTVTTVDNVDTVSIGTAYTVYTIELLYTAKHWHVCIHILLSKVGMLVEAAGK